jgi:hypothetical protein
MALRSGGRTVAQQTRQAGADALAGTFATRRLKPGVYTRQATLRRPGEGAKSAQQQVIVAPDPFAW